MPAHTRSLSRAETLGLSLARWNARPLSRSRTARSLSRALKRSASLARTARSLSRALKRSASLARTARSLSHARALKRSFSLAQFASLLSSPAPHNQECACETEDNVLQTVRVARARQGRAARERDCMCASWSACKKRMFHVNNPRDVIRPTNR